MLRKFRFKQKNDFLIKKCVLVHISLLLIYFICFNESLLKMMKDVFYFILKALFVLKISNFLSWIFGQIEGTALVER